LIAEFYLVDRGLTGGSDTAAGNLRLEPAC